MTNDNDLIRRGAILELCQTLEDEAPSGSYDNGGTTDGWMMACRRIEKAIAALPAVAASQTADSVTNADSCQRVVRETFPILGQRGATIDLQLVKDHGSQAQSNHGQTVARLAERGGLSWCELFAVLHNQRWQKMDENEAMIACRALEARYLAAIDMQPDSRDAQIAALVEALRSYERTFCEGFCNDLPERGTYHTSMELDCSGCKARAVLAAVKGENK